WVDRSVADSAGAAMVSGAVCAVRFALSRRASPDARAAGATTWSSRRGVRKARCRSGVVVASDDRCRDCALPSSRGGRSRGRNGKAAYVGVQTGKTLSRLEEDQTMIVARIGYRGIALNEAEAAANSPVPSWSQALSVCFWSTVPCLVLHFLVVPFSLTRRFPHGPSPRSHGRRSPLAETQPGHPAQLPVLRTPLRCLLHALPRRVRRSRGSPVPLASDRSQTP